MIALDKDKMRLVLRILQYTPVAITFYFMLSFWREGNTEGAVVLGSVCIGLTLLNLLLHIGPIRDKTVAIRKPLCLVGSVIITAVGVYAWVMGGTYNAIFYVLIGVTFLFMEILKGKWMVICCVVALVLAMGTLVLERINNEKSQAAGREIGVQQVVTSKRHFYT